MNRCAESRQSGVTLIEIMVALGLSIGIAAGIGIYIQRFDESRYRIEAMGTRDALALRLRRVISRNNLAYSAQNFPDAGNKALLACLNRGAANDCKAVDGAVAVSFMLGFPQGTKVQAISGTENSPVQYGHNGEVCTGKNRCTPEWEVRTFFKAICAFNQPSCSLATDIRVGFSVQNVSLRGQALLPSSPPSSAADRTSKVFTTVKISEPPEITSACNPNSTPVNKDNKGRLTCACVAGAKQTGTAAGQPVCSLAPLTCPGSGMIPIGFNADMSPRCIAQMVCKPLDLNQVCNGFINSLSVGGCSVTTTAASKKKKNDGSKTTDCAQNTYQCCTAN